MSVEVKIGCYYEDAFGALIGPIRTASAGPAEYPFMAEASLGRWSPAGRSAFCQSGADLVRQIHLDEVVGRIADRRLSDEEQAAVRGTNYREHPHFTGKVDAPVNHPAHYTRHPSGVECIQITEHMNFCRGNAVKYIWRAGDKGNEIEDLKKAVWYVEREIARLQKAAVDVVSEL